jgi:hypothetical protein
MPLVVPSHTQYRGSNTTEIGIGLLSRLNIREAVVVCLEPFPIATRGKERGEIIGIGNSDSFMYRKQFTRNKQHELEIRLI